MPERLTLGEGSQDEARFQVLPQAHLLRLGGELPEGAEAGLPAMSH